MEYDFETEYFDIWALGAEAAWKGVANVLEGELYKQSIFTGNPSRTKQILDHTFIAGKTHSTMTEIGVIAGLERFNFCGN